MFIHLNNKTENLLELLESSRTELLTAKDKAISACQTANTIEDIRKTYGHYEAIYGGFMAICRLIGTMNDEEWQKFLEEG